MEEATGGGSHGWRKPRVEEATGGGSHGWRKPRVEEATGGGSHGWRVAAANERFLRREVLTVWYICYRFDFALEFARTISLEVRCYCCSYILSIFTQESKVASPGT